MLKFIIIFIATLNLISCATGHNNLPKGSLTHLKGIVSKSKYINISKSKLLDFPEKDKVVPKGNHTISVWCLIVGEGWAADHKMKFQLSAKSADTIYFDCDAYKIWMSDKQSDSSISDLAKYGSIKLFSSPWKKKDSLAFVVQRNYGIKILKIDGNKVPYSGDVNPGGGRATYGLAILPGKYSVELQYEENTGIATYSTMPFTTHAVFLPGKLHDFRWDIKLKILSAGDLNTNLKITPLDSISKEIVDEHKEYGWIHSLVNE